jgi:hypothetical protein
MAAPNILNLNTATGKTTYLTPSGTSAVVLLQNAANSGKVFKINSIVVANLSGSTATNATVQYYTNGGVAQGSAPSGGTAYSIAYTITVPVQASLIVLDKTTELYVEENASITVTSGVGSNLTFIISYEELS